MHLGSFYLFIAYGWNPADKAAGFLVLSGAAAVTIAIAVTSAAVVVSIPAASAVILVLTAKNIHCGSSSPASSKLFAAFVKTVSSIIAAAHSDFSFVRGDTSKMMFNYILCVFHEKGSSFKNISPAWYMVPAPMVMTKSPDFACLFR